MCESIRWGFLFSVNAAFQYKTHRLTNFMRISNRTINYRARKAALVSKLGGHCKDCASTLFLQFDCCPPLGGEHHAMGSMQRISFYEKVSEQGGLQLRCPACHTIKSVREFRTRHGKIDKKTVCEIDYEI
jgi:hypothetical protein